YFGGGTPSRLEPADFRALVGSLERALEFVPGHERSLEANPEDLDLARLEAWRAGGVDRLSIGVQSFDEGELARLGRAHGVQAVREGVARARSAGFDNLSVDLLYAFPGATI